MNSIPCDYNKNDLRGTIIWRLILASRGRPMQRTTGARGTDHAVINIAAVQNKVEEL